MIDGTDIVKDYLRRYSDTPSRTIAGYIYNRHPELFVSQNACLNRVRYYRGKSGNKCRREMNKSNKFDTKIPRPKKKRKSTVPLREKGRWFVSGDWHVPFHDAKAMESAFRFAVDNKCDHILINGDALDCYQQSAWIKDPTQRHVDQEIEMLGGIIRGIEKHFKGRKVYKIGNHEARVENYLFQNAPRMIGMSKWNLCEVLRKELGLDDSWSFIASKQLYTLGKLHGYHGHELPRGLTNPVSVGRGLWLRTKQSGFTNHWHSVSTHVETDGAKKKAWTCFSLGCLCDLHPDYAPVNGWGHGCAYIDIDSNGNYSESNHRIVDGEIW